MGKVESQHLKKKRAVLETSGGDKTQGPFVVWTEDSNEIGLGKDLSTTHGWLPHIFKKLGDYEHRTPCQTRPLALQTRCLT